MKPTSFLSGVAVAFLLAIIGACTFHLGTIILPVTIAATLSVALTTTLYAVWLLAYAPQSVGRVITFTGWSLALATLMYFTPDIYPTLIGATVLLWLLRCLHYHTSFMRSAADLAVSFIAVGGAFWALTNSHSLPIMLWTLFLCQAGFAFVLAPSSSPSSPQAPASNNTTRFNSAERSAQNAIARLLERA